MTQFCVEEACATALDLHEAALVEESTKDASVSDVRSRHAELMEAAGGL